MKDDPLQGILFKTRPVHLQERAATRASRAASNLRQDKFFGRVQTFKNKNKRLSRPRAISVVSTPMDYEYSPIDRYI